MEPYDTLLNDVSNLKMGLSGNLAIGYNAPIVPAFLPALATQMLTAHPEVAFTFIEGDNVSVQKGLVEEQLDVILFVEELPNPQIEAQPLLFAPTDCLCSTEHALAKNER